MKNTFYLFALVLSLIACNKETRVVENIDFDTGYKLSSEIEGKLKTDTFAWKHQLSASDYATKGDYKNALKQWDLAMASSVENYTAHQIDSIQLKYTKVNAVDYIVEEAKNKQVVIINEAHHNTFHRVFTTSLLKKLYNNGFKNLGLEALENNDSLIKVLNAENNPNLKIGYYTKDPQFGNLIREALAIGYYVFAYENIGNGNGKPREIEQAKNIKKVIDSNPGEKFLIHCGFDHVLEGPHRSWEKAMAERLKDYTGIDPFTINQTLYSEKSRYELNHPFLKAMPILESTVLLDSTNKPLQYMRGKSYTDIAVLHPKTKYVNNRPNWLLKNNAISVPVDLGSIPIEFPVLVLAYNALEPINTAIPIDITELKNKTEPCNLALKQGNYEIVVTNKKESYTMSLKVK